MGEPGLAERVQMAADCDRGSADEIRDMCKRVTQKEMNVPAFVGGLLALSNVIVENSEHLQRILAELPDESS